MTGKRKANSLAVSSSAFVIGLDPKISRVPDPDEGGHRPVHQIIEKGEFVGLVSIVTSIGKQKADRIRLVEGTDRRPFALGCTKHNSHTQEDSSNTVSEPE